MHVSDHGGLLRARDGGEQRVTPLELFFDLVFVFALTQVTGFLADRLTWVGRCPRTRAYSPNLLERVFSQVRMNHNVC